MGTLQAPALLSCTQPRISRSGPEGQEFNLWELKASKNYLEMSQVDKNKLHEFIESIDIYFLKSALNLH